MSDEVIKKRGNPNFIKGGPSPNPSGRSKGSADIARYVASLTDDGREIVESLLSIARDKKSPARERKEAWIHLLDRMIGRPQESKAIQLQLDPPPPVAMLMALPDEQKLAWLERERQRRALAPVPLLLTDGEPHDDDEP